MLRNSVSKFLAVVSQNIDAILHNGEYMKTTLEKRSDAIFACFELLSVLNLATFELYKNLLYSLKNNQTRLCNF